MALSEHSEKGHIVFYIGQHESRRSYSVTEDILHHAQDSNYDMLTSPITNDTYHARVLAHLSQCLGSLDDASAGSIRRGDSVHDFAVPVLSSLTPADTGLSPTQFVSQIILVTSPWIDLASPDPLIADISRQVLNQEIAYAAFCGATHILISGPDSRYSDVYSEHLSQYARAIKGALSLGIYLQLHVMLPMIHQPQSESNADVGDLVMFAREQYVKQANHSDNGKADVFGSWDVWNLIRTVCNYSSRLSVGLTVPRQLPSQSIQSRWFCEPLRILSITGTTFLADPKGNHVLSTSHQQLIYRYMRLRQPPWILLTDVVTFLTTGNSFVPWEAHAPNIRSRILLSSAPTPAEALHSHFSGKSYSGSSESHVNYFRHQLERNQPPTPPIERFGAGYQDYLQSPLQPLTDNLESITYEVFEKDPVKYDWYERAIAAALTEWSQQVKPASGPDAHIVVAVLGAGRGPLVARALKASKISGISIELWALEKNPNAFVQLQRQNVEKWEGRVHLVQGDMRSWSGPWYETIGSSSSSPLLRQVPSSSDSANSTNRARRTVCIDIIISELLGSFGDNELSPECLDGAQHLLNPINGISIPSSYTAHLSPIAAPKLHADVNARIACGDPGAAEVPYVVMLHAIDFLSTIHRAAPKAGGQVTLVSPDTSPVVRQAWEFSHPLLLQTLQQSSGNMHNTRFARLEFPCENRGVCDGIAGYFECILYASSLPDIRDEHPQKSLSTNAGPKREWNKSHDLQYDKKGRIELSTNPLTMEQKSKDMISWFPMYFPLKTSMYVPDNSTLLVSIWRHTDGRKVWYEWMVETFVMGPGQKKVRLGVSELHSSSKNGCLM